MSRLDRWDAAISATRKADLDVLPAVVAQFQGWCATLHRFNVTERPSLVVVQQLSLAAWLQHLRTCKLAELHNLLMACCGTAGLPYSLVHHLQTQF